MVDLGPYPGILPAEPRNLTFDIIECTEGVFNDICAMEYGAGYTKEELKIEDNKYPIFVLANDYNKKEVSEGDWIKYKLLAKA